MSTDRRDLEDDQDGPGMAPPGETPVPSDRETCAGVTVSDKPCNHVVVPGLEVCHHHLDQATDVDTRDEPIGGDHDDEDDERPVWERHAEETLGAGGGA